jgi:hypothetical protein
VAIMGDVGGEPQGAVDVSRLAALDETYAGIDPAGLFWSMQPAAPDNAYPGAGRMIGIPYLPATVTESRHPDTAHASADAWPRRLRFLAGALKA